MVFQCFLVFHDFIENLRSCHFKERFIYLRWTILHILRCYVSMFSIRVILGGTVVLFLVFFFCFSRFFENLKSCHFKECFIYFRWTVLHILRCYVYMFSIRVILGVIFSVFSLFFGFS